MRKVCAWMICSLTLGFLGCNPPAADSSAESSSAPSALEVPAEPAPEGQTEDDDPAEEVPAEAKVKILDWESTLALVKQNAGKVVVVDFWATYCPPCIAEFPHLVDLHRTHGDEVACISVSVDFDGTGGKSVEDLEPKVGEFLSQQGASFDNVLLSTDAETLFNEKLEHKSVPIVYVYDRQGVLAGQFPDPDDPAEFTYQDQILPLVEKLLAN